MRYLHLAVARPHVAARQAKQGATVASTAIIACNRTPNALAFLDLSQSTPVLFRGRKLDLAGILDG
jgi:hypothetical protein